MCKLTMEIQYSCLNGNIHIYVVLTPYLYHSRCLTAVFHASSLVRGAPNTETQRGSSHKDQTFRVFKILKRKKKKGDQDTLSKIDYWTVIANNFCPSCTLLSKTRQEETEVISCWSTIEKSKSNAAAISLMLPQTATRKYEDSMARWQGDVQSFLILL